MERLVQEMLQEALQAFVQRHTALAEANVAERIIYMVTGELRALNV